MKLVKRDEARRWDPFREVERLQNEIANLFDWSIGKQEKGLRGLDFHWMPDFDIIDTEKEYVIKADLPGIDAKDIDVTVENGVLSIRGERKMEEEEKDKDYCCIERAYGSFTRSFQLPGEIQADNVKAKFKNGVLELHCPKSTKSQSKKVKIES